MMHAAAHTEASVIEFLIVVKKALERLREQLAKSELQATDGEENKETSLSTSKLNICGMVSCMMHAAAHTEASDRISHCSKISFHYWIIEIHYIIIKYCWDI
jgi:hypothetical protein